LRMVWKAHDWSMYFMGIGYRNSEWGLMGGYPSATGYRFEAHKTDLQNRIREGLSLPLGADRNPENTEYERHISATARVKRDQQCTTTEAIFENHDLYLNYMRGGPGFGDPLDRDCAAVEHDLNNRFVLPEFAGKVYGVVIAQDSNQVWEVDVEKTAVRRKQVRKERIARAVPTREWMKEERARILTKHASIQVRHMFATSFDLSDKFKNEFKAFWDLPDAWELPESELGVPSFGSKYRMDLSKLPDVRTVTLVEE
jgi:acetone carboxylase, alpha subunit